MVTVKYCPTRNINVTVNQVISEITVNLGHVMQLPVSTVVRNNSQEIHVLVSVCFPLLGHNAKSHHAIHHHVQMVDPVY